MGFFELFFGSTDLDKRKKTRAEIAKEKREKERKLWEMAEEYEEED